MRSIWIRAVLTGLVIVGPRPAEASGHGPVFGGAPPTLGKGGWQLDQAWMGRIGQGFGDDEQMLRTMISFGITEDLQISGSLPITLDSGFYMPRGRVMAMMSSNQDFESILGSSTARSMATGRRSFDSTIPSPICDSSSRRSANIRTAARIMDSRWWGAAAPRLERLGSARPSLASLCCQHRHAPSTRASS